MGTEVGEIKKMQCLRCDATIPKSVVRRLCNNCGRYLNKINGVRRPYKRKDS